MNEVIRKLTEQSGLKVESFMTNPPKPFQILGSTEQFEKFIELIVQECAQVAIDHDPFWGASVDQNIKQHFGVK